MKNKYLVLTESSSNNLNVDFEQGVRSRKNSRSPTSMEAAILTELTRQFIFPVLFLKSLFFSFKRVYFSLNISIHVSNIF